LMAIDFIEYCNANKVLLIVYLPHSTHTLQPLDVVMFAPLAAAYKAELCLHRSSLSHLKYHQKGLLSALLPCLDY
jgi:hypothetical protein